MNPSFDRQWITRPRYDQGDHYFASIVAARSVAFREGNLLTGAPNFYGTTARRDKVSSDDGEPDNDNDDMQVSSICSC